jgi:hypothetical protein
MRELDVYRQQLLKLYIQQLDELSAKIEPLSDRLNKALAPGEWSPHQVLAHVEAAERLAFDPRVHRILSEEVPVLENWDEAAWMEGEYDVSMPVSQLLDSVRSLRLANSEILNDLSSQEWSRAGKHPLRGDRTLQYWVEYAVAHVEDHLNQLSSS